eukprot:TRINITY_DN13648_c0_g1_i2.p1 TRINITY_DN13648_c0_g1~~TRINITY_DN13648_c0_g1_i2.p1  ORF type:complete len:321 (+),score=79.47 TRINITY_DN13648_c0_g1_i2:105-1067(+)
MLRCLAGICGSDGSRGGDATSAPVAETRNVNKPILKIGADYAPKLEKLHAGLQPLDAMLAECPELEEAPPGISPPFAAVGGNFRKNSAKLLVVLPGPGADWGTWDASLGEGRGDTVPLVRWGLANGYAVAVMNGQAMQKAPAKTWDEIMRGSPARFVTVIAAGDAVRLLREALLPCHPMMYARIRGVFASQVQTPEPALPNTTAAEDVEKQLGSVAVYLPDEWLRHDAFVMHQCMMQLFEDRFGRWQDTELKKYMGFQGLKENDMPGLKRMPLEVRIKRMDRDREDDELARLLRKHEKASHNIANVNVTNDDEEEEPGID